MHRIVLLTCIVLGAAHSFPAAAADPVRALLVAGGCCHDYARQHEILARGIQERALVRVDVVWTDDKSTDPPLPIYGKADWAKGYDVILHDECAASMRDGEVLTRILEAHKTVPAVHLHCAMHSFRTGEERWFRHLGVQSNSHGPQEPIAITFVDKGHPITETLEDWTTIKEELYNNVNVFDAHPLATGRQVVKGRAVDAIVAWTNEKAGARSFSTTIGHNSETVADARYLEMVTRGLLWACGKLRPEYLVPYAGKNEVKFVAGKPAEVAKPPVAPKGATGIKVTAGSEETGKQNWAWRALDGDAATRWCASGPGFPQWLQLELEKEQEVTGLEVLWESQGNAYRHHVEGSVDGKTWMVLADASGSPVAGDSKHEWSAKKLRMVKITCEGTSHGGWASVREARLKGPGIKVVAPKLSEAQKKADEKANDPLAKEGNVAPKIVRLTAEEEAAILKDVKVAEGFEVSLFANSAAANYPVFVAAAVDGTLYVSSDGNGSLGRNPKRGRVIRLRDLDGDGRADETKVFCEVDSPRGLVWDHDRLYLVHPPHLSEFIDADGDGVAEKQNVLVRDIAFGFKDRPADHTTNGLSLGIDGWLYVAVGDFGFMKAVGTDGRELQMRGGGVVRVRPDGTGLETYSTGTRNILEVAISPFMDLFARDNTNDGGGWNVRFHHFTGLDDHGYPRLYKNFNDECIQPLADYGGGSGCGAVYIDEPGFGDWNNAPFTADWGTGALYHHQLQPKGATFEETRQPEPFIRMTRPTDADVDGMSSVYCASWKGATFNWEGPDVGYIVQVRPKGWHIAKQSGHLAPRDESGVTPTEAGSEGGSGAAKGSHLRVSRSETATFAVAPLPDFGKAGDEELVKVLESASNRRRMEAQREFTRRLVKLPRMLESRALSNKTYASLITHELNLKADLRSRAAAMYGLASLGFDENDFGIHKHKLGVDSRVDDLLPRLENAQAGAIPAALPEIVARELKLEPHSAYGVDESSQVRQWPKNESPILRLASARQIGSGMLSPEASVSVLTDAFADSDVSVQHALRSGCVRAALSCDGKTVVSFGGDVNYAAGKSEVKKAVMQVFDAAKDKTVSQQCLQVLMRIHTPEVVAGLIERLCKATDPALRQSILAALCRLHFKEGEWKGDSWGTRPDTRGPYYQPEAWSETPKIAVALKDALAKAGPEEAAFLVKEMNRNRIQFNEAQQRLLELAKADERVLPELAAQMAGAEEIPGEAVPLLVKVLQSSVHSPSDEAGASKKPGEKGDEDVRLVTRRVTATLADAIIALSKTDSAEGVDATLRALEVLKRLPDSVKDYESALNAFLSSPKLENHHQLVEQTAAKAEWAHSMHAYAALLNLANRKTGSPESIQLSQKALDTGWADAKQRKLIVDAISATKHMASAGKVLAALEDADAEVRGAAERAAKAMRIQRVEDKTPKLASLTPEEAVKAVMGMKGDAALGEVVFTRATCAACHTVKESEAQKGPYLGNIAQTYKREELALNILDPNRTIAQGFASEAVTLKDGTQQMGFITLEGAEEIKLRNIASQEFTFKTAEIQQRQKLPVSMMPAGLMMNFTVREFASLLDYLEALAKP